MEKTHVVIIGGGLSGLAAAVYLLKGGEDTFDVSIFEGEPHLGGQAASWLNDGKAEETGIHLDFLPWYTNHVGLYDDIGSPLELVQTDGNYYICNGVTGRIDTLYAGAELGTTGWYAGWRALVKSARGLATFPGLTFAERWWLVKFIGKILRMSTAEIDRCDIPTDEFLCRMGATPALIRQLSLETVTIQGLRIDEASATSFIKFLKATYGCSAPLNPAFFAQPTGDALIEPLAKFVRERGCRIFTGLPVRAVGVAHGRALHVRTADRWFLGDHVVMAMPGYLVPRLIPETYRAKGVFSRLSRLRSASVTTLTLWYEKRWFPDHNVYISNREGVIFDAVADKAHHWKDPDHPGSIVQVLIDAADDVARCSDEEVLGRTLMDLARFFPYARYPRELRPASWSIKKHSNIYCETRPGYWSTVPRSHETPIRNLYLAGDYTAGLYHYGMESAVISGKEVANLIRAQNGLAAHPTRPVSFLPFMKK